jgi:hypothetical protein
MQKSTYSRSNINKKIEKGGKQNKEYENTQIAIHKSK